MLPMTTSSATYSGLPFPCSQAGIELPADRIAASSLVAGCDLEELLRLGRPADEQVRQIWLRRFINEMHWLPVIEVLAGCCPEANPSAHGDFIAALADRDVPRIAHRPSDFSERQAWCFGLRDRIVPLCPDEDVRGMLAPPAATVLRRNGDVFFVADGCIAAAEEARATCLLEPAWLFYKAAIIHRGQLPDDQHRVMMHTRLAADPSAEAYFTLLQRQTMNPRN
jgi:hypothetical protein